MEDCDIKNNQSNGGAEGGTAVDLGVDDAGEKEDGVDIRTGNHCSPAGTMETDYKA